MGHSLTHCAHNGCCGSLTTKVHLVPLFLLRKTVRSCFARCYARFAPPGLLLLHKSIAVPDGFCIAKKTIGIREIRACPLRGRHIPGFASLGASHASPLHAAHAPPPQKMCSKISLQAANAFFMFFSKKIGALKNMTYLCSRFYICINFN
jgi:hypothetical protein